MAQIVIPSFLSVAFLALVAVAYDTRRTDSVRLVREGAEATRASRAESQGPPRQSTAVANDAIPQSIELASSIRYEKVRFGLCGRRPVTCVVDGDTFWLEGVKIRLADIDTPEVGSPQCDAERVRGIEATHRLIELLNAGPFELKLSGGKSLDRYGRQLRLVEREGDSIGQRLVVEGLAHPWLGYKQSWCD